MKTKLKTLISTKICPECKSDELSWNCGVKNHGTAQNNRLNLHEVGTIFILGCECCSETVGVVTGDEVAELLNDDMIFEVKIKPTIS